MNNESIDENENNEDENLNENDEDFEVLVDFLQLIVKFLLHYGFGVYLYTISNEENSHILSFTYMIFALISFSKV